MYKAPNAAPKSAVAEDRRGPEIGRFCVGCAGVYPPYRRRHTGKPMIGRDHVASPCAHEGREFQPDEPWWEPAVEVLPAGC